jgi:hypothetical protein
MGRGKTRARLHSTCLSALAFGLSVVARPGGESAVAHGAQLPAERLLGDRDAEFLEDPLRQIDQPPADHAVLCRNRALSMMRAMAWRRTSLSLDGCPGDLPFRRRLKKFPTRLETIARENRVGSRGIGHQLSTDGSAAGE